MSFLGCYGSLNFALISLRANRAVFACYDGRISVSIFLTILPAGVVIVLLFAGWTVSSAGRVQEIPSSWESGWEYSFC